MAGNSRFSPKTATVPGDDDYQDDKNYHAKIDLAAKTVISTVKMPSFGEDVK